mmetsp:Transcript_2442/g.8965  ORF Transcript_2442/g.8965 Transcript_2442/m.8965 type:complete len:258 (+) Transcript_2442:2010-2783(+)
MRGAHFDISTARCTRAAAISARCTPCGVFGGACEWSSSSPLPRFASAFSSTCHSSVRGVMGPCFSSRYDAVQTRTYHTIRRRIMRAHYGSSRSVVARRNRTTSGSWRWRWYQWCTHSISRVRTRMRFRCGCARCTRTCGSHCRSQRLRGCTVRRTREHHAMGSERVECRARVVWCRTLCVRRWCVVRWRALRRAIGTQPWYASDTVGYGCSPRPWRCRRVPGVVCAFKRAPHRRPRRTRSDISSVVRASRRTPCAFD